MLYLDTSALVKRYVAEIGSATVTAAITAVLIRATCIVAFAELRAAFTRALSAGRLDFSGHASAVSQLDVDWTSLFVLLLMTYVCVRPVA